MVFALLLLFAQMIHCVPRTLAQRELVLSRTFQKAGEYSSQPFTCIRSMSLTKLLRMDSVMISILARLMHAVPPRDASTHLAPRILVTTAMTARLIRATSSADATALPFQTVAGMAFAKKVRATAALQTAPRGHSRSEGSNAPLV